MMAKGLADFMPMLQSVGLPSISGTSPPPATRLTLQAQLGKISIYKGGGEGLCSVCAATVYEND